MVRTFTITDYGKDYGFGRYALVIDDGLPFNPMIKEGTNSEDFLGRMLQEWADGTEQPVKAEPEVEHIDEDEECRGRKEDHFAEVAKERYYKDKYGEAL